MRNDLISRKALKKQIKDSITEYGNTYSNDLLNGLGMVLQMLDNAPTVEIPTELCKDCRFLKGCETCEEKLRPQGKWIDVNGDGSLWKCNNCGEKSCCKGNYCPDCGADMKGGAENEQQSTFKTKRL